MKRFLVISILILLFSSCSLRHNENWIVASVETDANTQLVRIFDPYDVYFITNINTDIRINYFIIPDSDLRINETDIKIQSLDENIIDIKSIDYENQSILVHAKNIGNTEIKLNTKQYKNTSITIFVNK